MTERVALSGPKPTVLASGAAWSAPRHLSRTVGSVIEYGALNWPDRTALEIEGSVLKYSDLPVRAAAARRMLSHCGLVRGDGLLIMLENSLEYVDAFLGCATAGVLQIPINTQYRGNLLRYEVEHSAAAAILIAPQYLDRLAEAAPFSSLRRIIVAGDLPAAQVIARVPAESLTALMGKLAGEPSPPPQRIEEWDPMGVMYTSGTTGPSKGVLTAHRHAYEYSRGAAAVAELHEGDVYYAPLPLFHIAGQWAVMYASWITGATAVFKKRFSVREFWDDVRRHNVTVTFLLGAMAQFLAGQLERADDADNPLERVLMVPLVADLLGFRTRFDVRVTTCYASTDVNLPIRADFTVDDPTVAGRAVAGYHLRLVDQNDNDVPAGHVGELVVRPPEDWMTMVEYRGNPEATTDALRNMWLHSGDMFRLDADGVFRFIDRLKDAIRKRGENISSFEVELEVNAHPAVAESAAIAIPSQHTEDEVGVVVVPRAGMTIDPDELRRFVEARAPRFMVPDVVWVLEEMPKTPTGKILKHVLRTRFATDRDNQAAERKH